MKKYSDKFLNQSSKLKNAKLGFEFEFYLKDLSFYKTLEMMNIELDPVRIWGFRKYHSDFTPDKKMSSGRRSNCKECVRKSLTGEKKEKLINYIKKKREFLDIMVVAWF